MSNILIVGGGMGNKGAQSMTFIAVDELKKRFPDDQIFLMTPMEFDSEIYNFKIVHASYRSLNYLKTPINMLKALIKRIHFNETRKLDYILKDTRMLIDISGYALSSKWAFAIVNYYLTAIECAKVYNIPVYILPQSFGPFEYEGENAENIMTRIGCTMKYPKIIFAREQEGYEEMIEKFGLSNMVMSYDMVLMNKGVHPEKIYKAYKGNAIEKINQNSVAVLPNMRNFDYGNKKSVMEFYQVSIQWLLEHQKSVYLMHHASEDAVICKEIKLLFEENSDVHLLDNEFDCFEYEEIVKQFDFIIASRYHSIIHALRNHIPCIALGWATKYIDLLNLFNQGKYMFDARKGFNQDIIIDTLDYMNNRFHSEKKVIEECLEDIQKNNIFDMISKMEA